MCTYICLDFVCDFDFDFDRDLVLVLDQTLSHRIASSAARIPFRIRNCSTVRVLDVSIDAGRSQKAHLPSTTTQATTTTAQAKSRTSDDATVTELSTPEVALEEARTTNKTNSKQFVSYMTVRVHLQNYASAWLLIFVVLFLLIMILSR